MKLKRFVTLFTACVALFMTTISAQPGGGGMGGPGGGMGGPMGGQGGPGAMGGGSSSMDPVAMTGYFEMDVEKAIKKCKVKSEEAKSTMRKLFAEFAIGSGNVYTSYPEEFVNLEEMKKMIAAAQMGESSDDMRSSMKSMMESSMTIKREMTPLHKALNSGIEEVLAESEKSLSRWKLYYKDICDSNNYSERERRQSRGEGEEGGQRGGMEGGQRGMGGPGGMGGF
ncbi:MAG: hypothetical protein SNH55_05140 [Rikenellaceae bacterium]